MGHCNPCGGGRELLVPAWEGAWHWLAEIKRQLRVMQCRSGHHRRFSRTCARLTPARIRAADVEAVELILELLEAARRGQGRLQCERTGWSRAEIGELVVEARNRLTLAALGRDRARVRGPRFDPSRIPLERLEALIQRHPDMRTVELLRTERNARISRPVSVPLRSL